ncbi:MAG: peptidase [Prolixibacteraceae bacterium]|nr:peptidase [Prolixibacteraceae bacterium]
MKSFSKKHIRKWLRIIHRDLGYFLVGITLVYAVSGIILNHKKVSKDPAYKTISFKNNIEKSLTTSEIELFFFKNVDNITLKKILPGENNQYQLIFEGGIGSYEPETGQLFYEIYQRKPLIFFINKLHYNQKKHWTIPADFFSIGLIFLTLSGLFMVRGKNGFQNRGIWFITGGIILVLIYIWI